MKFNIIVTRETTESCNLTVEADNQEEAEESAFRQACADHGANVDWTHDECSGMQSEPYITGIEEENCDG